MVSFLDKKATIPTFHHPYDKLAVKYLEHVQYMLIGYNEWAILTARYFDDPQKKLGQSIPVEMPKVGTV